MNFLLGWGCITLGVLLFFTMLYIGWLLSRGAEDEQEILRLKEELKAVRRSNWYSPIPPRQPDEPRAMEVYNERTGKYEDFSDLLTSGK